MRVAYNLSLDFSKDNSCRFSSPFFIVRISNSISCMRVSYDSSLDLSKKKTIFADFLPVVVLVHSFPLHTIQIYIIYEYYSIRIMSGDFAYFVITTESCSFRERLLLYRDCKILAYAYFSLMVIFTHSMTMILVSFTDFFLYSKLYGLFFRLRKQHFTV